MSAPTTQVGDIATYTCVDYLAHLHGKSQRVCQNDGTWEGDAPVCNRNGKRVKIIENKNEQEHRKKSTSEKQFYLALGLVS